MMIGPPILMNVLCPGQISQDILDQVARPVALMARFLLLKGSEQVSHSSVINSYLPRFHSPEIKYFEISGVSPTPQSLLKSIPLSIFKFNFEANSIIIYFNKSIHLRRATTLFDVDDDSGN
jgi:hypothetical protein